MKALNTPLTKLRRIAPGSLRQQDVAIYMRRKGLDRATITVGDFERGKIEDPGDRFINLYAEVVKQPPAVVRDALRKTRRSPKARKVRQPPGR